jgi:nucleoside-triphosphatase THEP1
MNIVIVSGERGEGKTTFLKKAAAELRNRGISLFGFFAGRVVDEQGREGYKIHKLPGGQKMLLCRRDAPETGNLHLLDFWFDESAVSSGEKWLKAGFNCENPFFILDEAGKFELDGYVWDSVLQQLINNNKGTLIIAVRNKFTDKIIEKYKLNKHRLTVKSDLLFTIEFIDKIERRQNN